MRHRRCDLNDLGPLRAPTLTYAVPLKGAQDVHEAAAPHNLGPQTSSAKLYTQTPDTPPLGGFFAY